MSYRLYCVRHGRTAWNAAGRFQGQSDIPLDDVGREQAAQTAEKLADLPLHVAVSSDLQRARETAEIVLQGRIITLELDPGLRERSFGEWEGLNWEQIVARHPEHADHTVMNARVFEPPGGERFAQTVARAQASLERLSARMQSGQSALLVAHAGMLHALLDVLLGPERENLMITPASVMALDVEAGRGRLVSGFALA